MHCSWLFYCGGYRNSPGYRGSDRIIRIAVQGHPRAQEGYGKILQYECEIKGDIIHVSEKEIMNHGTS